MFEMESGSSHDIDTEEDFVLAERLLQQADRS
jgi:CMP-N-acetylneuraminic acid synthetase